MYQLHHDDASMQIHTLFQRVICISKALLHHMHEFFNCYYLLFHESPIKSIQQALPHLLSLVAPLLSNLLALSTASHGAFLNWGQDRALDYRYLDKVVIDWHVVHPLTMLPLDSDISYYRYVLGMQRQSKAYVLVPPSHQHFDSSSLTASKLGLLACFALWEIGVRLRPAMTHRLGPLRRNRQLEWMDRVSLPALYLTWISAVH